jgi:S-DNA-T family DNA segregation ATPase FtsK/SpoIIIE
MFSGIRKFVTALWLGIAHVVGAITRGVGRSARDLDPAHRRDGLGLLYLSLAIVAASVIWFDVAGFVAGVVTSLVTGAVGIFDLFAPVALAVIAVQTLRHPDAPSQKKGRLTIGWTLFALSTMGITHIQRGNPLPSSGAQAMRDAAGWTGWAVTAPFVSAVGTVVTVLLLLVVAFFSVLIITATPVNTIPVKLHTFKSKFSRVAIDDEAEAAAHPNLEAISAAQAQLALDVTPVVHRTRFSRLRRKSNSDAAVDPALAGVMLSCSRPCISMLGM